MAGLETAFYRRVLAGIATGLAAAVGAAGVARSCQKGAFP